MKKLALALSVLAFMCGCGGGTPTVHLASFTITTTSLPSGAVGEAYSASVAVSGGTSPYTWSVTSGTLPGGLSLNSSTGVISGTPTAAGTSNFTVNVTDSSTPTPQTATAPLAITIKLAALTITTTSLPNGAVGEAYSASVAVSGGTSPYTWSVTSGTLPAGLSLNSSTGVISGVPTAAGTSNFTVNVTDSSTPTQTATEPLAITINAAAACTDSGHETLLNGQYAFSLSGFDTTGFLAAVGSFTADGGGHITAGEVDSNGALGVQQADINTSASSYSIGSNALGCATIATSFGTFTTRFALGTLSSGKATEGRMIEWETGSSAYIAAGQILEQTASSFNVRLSGNYAFEQAGWTNNGRLGAVGVMSVGGGFITTGEMDSNEAGVTSNITGVTGSYSSADTNGRLTLTTTWSGQSATDLVGYMVSGPQLLIMTTDPTGGVVAGELNQQSGTFKDSSLSGNLVFYDTGLATPLSGGRAEFGLIDANGSGSLKGTDYVDDAGTWQTPNPSTLTCSYSVAANGRVTLSGSSCTPTAAWYLTAANTAVLLSAGADVAIGQVEPQTAGPFTTAFLPSTFYFGTLEAGNQDVETAVGVGTASSGSVNGTQDITATTSQTPDQDIEFRLTVNSNGTLISSDAPGLVTGIMISKTVFVNVANQSGAYPTIQVFKQ